MVCSLLQRQMDKLEELLPGIEEFLCSVLSEEKLSPLAEEQRQYYLERLDILKLPPSLPPRPSALALKLPEEVHNVTVNHPNHEEVMENDEPDFAAYQREISRTLMMRIKPPPPQDKVKLYDDIDQEDTSDEEGGDKKKEDQDLYEIPVTRAQVSGDGKTDLPSGEPPPEPSLDNFEIKNSDAELMPPPLPDVKPPALPPRRDRAMSDSQSRSSIGSIIDDKPPQLPSRPHLPPKSELSGLSDKSENRSEKSDDHTDADADRISYGSYDDELHDTELLNKLEIRLPKPLKKHKRNKKMTGSRTSTQWEITLSFSSLEDIALSGELYYKGKLSWTKRLIALSNGLLLGYKPERTDLKPVFTILVSGYEATFHERDARKGYEIKLSQSHSETHHFSVDFKDWAQLWCDYINAVAEDKGPPGQYSHLARTAFPGYTGSKLDIMASNSNLSTASSDCLDQEPEHVRRRYHSGSSNSKKMGKFAFRATQFFETIGRKTGKKLGLVGSSSLNFQSGKDKSTSSESAQIAPSTMPFDPVFPTVDVKDKILAFSPTEMTVKHQGYLNIFSSFNKRKWGKRWCLVKENMFECYNNDNCKVLELDFLLRNCVLRRAVQETKSVLGLMLMENNSEKITIEPLGRDDVPGWLWILMKETSTESIPEGLEEFWEEQPYDVIHADDLNQTGWSDMLGYSSIELNSPNLHSTKMSRDESHYELGDESDILSGTDIVQKLHHSPNQRACDSGIAGESADESRDLYTPVRRKSGVNIGSLQQANAFRYKNKSEEQQKRNVIIMKDNLALDGHQRGDTSTQSHGDANSDVSSVNELLSHFERIHSQIDDSDSENKVDTAYYSGCSENNSLDRVSETDSASVRHSATEIDDEIDKTDKLVSPIEDSAVSESFSETNAVCKQNSSPNEIKKDTFQEKLSVLKTTEHDIKLNIDQLDEICAEKIQNYQESLGAKNNLNSIKIDSSLIENDFNYRIDDDCDDRKTESFAVSITQKIEGLRTKLVDLKKKRISTRDHRLTAETEDDKATLDEEYRKLDENCRCVTNEILSLEEILKQNYSIGWMKL